MNDERTDAALACLEALLKKTQDAIYVPLAELEVTVWRTKEPVPFEQREQGQGRRVAVGERWGEELFDCAWMRFRAHLPEMCGHCGRLVARIDINGELLLVDKNGDPLRGLTNVKSTFDPTLGGPAKTIFDIPDHFICNGEIELWGDAGLNDLFGYIKDDGRIALAQVAWVREEYRQLYYDLETLRDYLIAVDKETAKTLAEALMSALLRIDAEITTGGDVNVAALRKLLEEWFGGQPVANALRVHAVGHAHIDLAWLWPIRETIRKGARTFASVLYNIERYPEYVFGASQAQLFAWMKAFYPSLYVRIKDAVLAGRIEVQGTFWVEPDCNIPSGESLVRQIVYGRRFFRDEFGIVPDYCWEPDVFGYNGQLPQILKRSGHRCFMTQKLSWNVVNRFPLQSFQWEGIDGSRILAHMLPEETYNGPAAARSLLKIDREYAQKDVSSHALMVYGIGDGGGGPDAEHLERLRRAHRLPGMPSVQTGTADAFFKTWQQEAAGFPVWRGELYLERHQGTLTTQALVKRNNRRCEIALRELEWACVLASKLSGAPIPTEALDRLWKEVLLYQFHDILPGSSIKRVYDECNPRYAAILEELTLLTEERYRLVASARSPRAKPGIDDATFVFNSLGWQRTQWLKTAAGWVSASVPAFGWIEVGASGHGSAGRTDASANDRDLVAAQRAGASLKAEACLLENEHLRVVFGGDGGITSIVDKKSGREFLAQHGAANGFVIIEDLGDAWDFETDYANKDTGCYLRRPLHRPELLRSVASVDGPCALVDQVWRYKSSEIRQRVCLFSGSGQIDFEVEADWREEAMMLRLRFAGAAAADYATCEIPFGWNRRSTLEETSEQKAQIEVAAQQWVDISADDFGLALYNDSKYGFRVKGGVIDMCVLRSVPHPGAAAPLIDRDDQSKVQLPGVNFTDIGKHCFRYALRPHDSAVDPALLSREARNFNTPLAIVSVVTGENAFTDAMAMDDASASGAGREWLRVEPSQIEIAAVKPAENRRDWVLRLINLSDKPVEGTLTIAFPVQNVIACDLVESPLADAPLVVSRDARGGAVVRIDLLPFEVKTLQVQ